MKRSVILTDRLGPDILLVLTMKRQVLHRERAHLKVPGCSLVLSALLTKKLPTFLSRLNEISGGCEKIKLLQNDPETGRIFSQPPLISFKRDKNVGNFLVRSALKTNEQPGTFKCARSRCNTCRFIVNTSKISGPKRSVKITDRFTCTSANVIYCITCTLCNKLYIGETGRRLGDRFREHLRDVEKNDKDASKPVARHFNLPNHSKKHMAVCGLSLHLGTTESRKNLEQKFIFQIGTLNPHGINERFSFN